MAGTTGTTGRTGTAGATGDGTTGAARAGTTGAAGAGPTGPAGSSPLDRRPRRERLRERARRHERPLVALLAALLLAAWLGGSALVADGPHPREVPLDAALRAATAAEEVSYEEGPGRLVVTAPDGAQVVSAVPRAGAEEVLDRLLDARVPVEVEPAGLSPTDVLLPLLPVLLLLAVLVVVLRRQGGALGLSGGKRLPAEVPTTRFDDVIGAEETVAELREVVTFLHDPGAFAALGARMPRGLLFSGPPGTGKTLLARALAGEAGVPVFIVSGSEFVEVFAGKGAARVRELFAQARKHPAAIVFLDEIDAVGRRRTEGGGSGADGEAERTLNQLLVELDGFGERGHLVVIGATNRPEMLDPALTRPGRFDRTVAVGLPDRRAREGLLRHYAAGKVVADDVDWALLSRRTPGMSGAQLEQLLNEAALEAVRTGAARVDGDHVATALATVALGKASRHALVSERDRAVTAWHEAGHTLCALLLPGAHPPVQVSIVPRGHAGGVTWMAGSDDAFLARSAAHAQLAVALGGRAAEELLLDGDPTTGAHNDLESATSLATSLVARYGLAGTLAVHDGPPTDAVRARVEELLVDALERARTLLREHRALLDALAELLLLEEDVEHAAVAALARAHGVEAVNVPGR
ncbi:ATP-dependent metallopeptidase FtsH/Yme1/Tma family protein [Vallicoccus soli]|uniref:AAA family ATPase n=1 Tax=Vallicoccus soli TaxID=2339232 RepID=A0A3A3Z4Q6_9ACTN|nr:AAA family ATPase [Vallicoccus soli]RJK97953.1 AAA family ATPase [Vallicoccus soli]